MTADITWFDFAAAALPGLLLVGAAIPLIRRQVPPNRVYGVHLFSIYTDEEVWYEVNAAAGRHTVIIVLGYLALLGALAIVGRRSSSPLLILGPIAFFVLAVVADGFIIAAIAKKSMARRTQRSSHPP
jgi:hypothetical protein